MYMLYMLTQAQFVCFSVSGLKSVSSSTHSKFLIFNAFHILLTSNNVDKSNSNDCTASSNSKANTAPGLGFRV